MKHLKYYLDLMRAKNCLTASFGTIIGGLIASGFNLNLVNNNIYYILIASFIVFLICGFGNALNDIYDIEIDKINKPFRPLPSNKISLKNAKIFSWLLVSFGIIISIFNRICFVIAIINAIALYLYAKKYKKNKIIGNLIVAYLTGSVFIFGGASVNNVGITLILFLCAMFATWSREIIKDFEDTEGDLKEGVMSLPIRYGDKSLYIAGIFLIVAVILSPLPYIMGMFGDIYLIGITICDILFIYSILKLIGAPSKSGAKKSSKNIKYIMNLVLLCFVIGSILK
ncbi:UbiA family prenyltransferase [Methanothermococcus okinawensis]|uniref:Digeranylgeranylglyceryl phosphate synthase n=1 Tax=Methanothermococcus okinawensis (strain DSM 14208 / JCM 11175 / IH1) TaxID=647113 RepID=F8AN44_METOI|nr:UbiA family prenyltransferase [Methanothermococcus okinawensis]AEH06958.1 Digeranylgeranylglyceryl phosphate synthase [Methanothermococcus okinawensis IH1]